MKKQVGVEVPTPAPGGEAAVRKGLFNRPRQPGGSFRSFLQSLGSSPDGGPREFGGRRSGYRCERAAPELYFLICDERCLDVKSLKTRILEGAAEFGYQVQVDQIERREVSGRDVFAIRELAGRSLGYGPS